MAFAWEVIGKVDFIWDPPGLIVEWDGLRFHSTRRQKEHDVLELAAG